jgi:hypothetical protein
MHCVIESTNCTNTMSPSTLANPPPQALAQTTIGEVVLSFLLTVTAREYRPAAAQDNQKAATQFVPPGCTANMSECNAALLTANSAAGNKSHGDQVMNRRTWKGRDSTVIGGNSVMPDNEVISQHSSDFSNMTSINSPLASRTDNGSDIVNGSTVTQFGPVSSHPWKQRADRTHISHSATDTERSVRSRRHSAAARDFGVGVTGVNIGANNVSEFRTNEVGESNNKIYFHKMWKNIVSQNRTFSAYKSQTQEKPLFNSADDNSVDDWSADDSVSDWGPDVGVDDRSAGDSSTVVQNLVKRDAQVETLDSASTATTVNSVVGCSGTSNDSNTEQCKQCPALVYIVCTWVLCLVALATALKLYYLVKTTLATVMVTVFTTLFLVASLKE